MAPEVHALKTALFCKTSVGKLILFKFSTVKQTHVRKLPNIRNLNFDDK